MATTCARCGFSSATQDPEEFSHGDRTRLRHRLTQLNTVIATLNAERQRLQAQSDAIVYPVLCLPPELTSLIFIHCVTSSGCLPHPSPIEAPLLLTQICRQWREVAVSTPELWQSIALVDTRYRSVDLLKTWLSRSGSLPLNFSLNSVDPVHGRPLLNACMSHASRWQDVELALPVGVLKRFDETVPLVMLRRISLSLRGPSSRDAGLRVHPIGSWSAPLLRQATVTTYPDLKFELPWAQLTVLKLGRLDNAECFAILRLCPGLVTLDISTTGADPIPDEEPLTLEFLESFTFPSDFCSAVEHFRIPRLIQISIRETVSLDAEHATALRALISSSSAVINHLSLLLKYPDSTTLERCLEAMPAASLNTLSLVCGNATKVAPLLGILARSTVLPALKTLHIFGGRLFDADYEAIPSMLAARRGSDAGGGGGLEEFDLLVQTYGRLDATRCLPRIRAMPRFRALAAQGLKIRIAVAGELRVGEEVLIDTLTTVS